MYTIIYKYSHTYNIYKSRPQQIFMYTFFYNAIFIMYTIFIIQQIFMYTFSSTLIRQETSIFQFNYNKIKIELLSILYNIYKETLYILCLNHLPL